MESIGSVRRGTSTSPKLREKDPMQLTVPVSIQNITAHKMESSSMSEEGDSEPDA